MHISLSKLNPHPFGTVLTPCRRFRSWTVTGMLPWSAILFTVGFILRAIGAFGEWDNVPIYIASTVFLLAGP